MSTRINYQTCPACKSSNIAFSISCQDFTVSQETFEIWQCKDCTLRFTQQVPDSANIGIYYQSDDYISHSDTSVGLVNKMYKLARRYTLGRKRQLVHNQTGFISGHLLDVGCGTGAFLNEMKGVGWQVSGIEPHESARTKAMQLYQIKPYAANALFTLKPVSFQAITLWHVLEHVHQLHEYLQKFKQLLAPGGKLFIAVPNYQSADANHYQQHWAAYDVPRHLYHFSPKAMKTLASLYGFEITHTKALFLDAYYISILSEKYKNGKGSLIKAGWQGLKATFKTLANRQQSSSLVYVLTPAGSGQPSNQ